MRRPRAALAATAVVATACALVFVALATEFVLSLREWRGSRGATAERLLQLRELPPNLDATIHPRRQDLDLSDTLEDRRYRLRTDEEGFIRPSRRHAAPDLTIAFLGGSTTECRYLDEEERLPHRSALALEARAGLAVNALNGGVAGNHTLHSASILLAKVAGLSPDAVVFMHNINDLSVLLYEGSYWNANPTRSLLQTRVTAPDTSLLFALAPRLVSRVRRRGGAAGAEAPPDEFAGSRGVRKTRDPAALRAEFGKSLRLLVALCRARGIEPVLMTEASRLTPRPDPVIAANVAAWHLEENWGFGYEEFRGLYDSFNDTIRTVARETGTALVDLAALVPPERRYLYDVVHYTADGSRLASERVAEILAGLPALARRRR